MSYPTPSQNSDQSRYLFHFVTRKNVLTCYSKSLEKALRDALKSVLEKDVGSDPRASFYNRFREEIAEHDDDFQEKHGGDLDTTLIFVSSSPLVEPTRLTT